MKVLTGFCQIAVLFSVTITMNSQSSTSSMQNKSIGVGDMASDFTLEDQNHDKATLSDARGRSPVVLVFYRGYWRPFCARQLAGLRTLLKKNENVKLFAISVDPPDVSKSFAEK